MNNGGYFSTQAIFPILALEEKNHVENEKRLLELLDKYGWPAASEVKEYAAAGTSLIINHTTYELRSKYFPGTSRDINSTITNTHGKRF